MQLQGRWVLLRELRGADAEMTLAWRLSSRAKFLQRGATTLAGQRAWIEQKVAASDELNFIIEYRGVAVGMIALVAINRRHSTVELGRFLIGEPKLVASAPVAFEAELLLADYAFDQLQMHKIYGDVMIDNTAIIRARLYQGYHQDGILRHHYIYDGEYKDTVVFSLLESEYRSTCRPKLMQLISVFEKFSADGNRGAVPPAP